MLVDRPIAVGFPTRLGHRSTAAGHALVVTRVPPHQTLTADHRRPPNGPGPQPIVPLPSLIALAGFRGGTAGSGQCSTVEVLLGDAMPCALANRTKGCR